MQSITVRDAMTTDVDTVPLTMSLDDLADEFARSHHHGFPVVDGAGDLIGVVSIQDLERARAASPIDGRVVADIATREGVLVTYPYEPMWKALRRLGMRDVGRLPVVKEEGSRQLIGVVRRSDIIRAYDRAIAARAQHQHRAELLRLGQVDGTNFLHLRIPSDSSAVGHRISELKLPEECLIISVRRGRKLHMAHGSTVLAGGDQVAVFASSDCAREVQCVLTGESVDEAGPS
jgi:CIC family chloride channel protein